MGHVDDLEEYAQHRSLLEAEAESVAFVVAGLAGFVTSAYSVGYVATSSDCKADTIYETAAQVHTHRASHQPRNVPRESPPLPPIPSRSAVVFGGNADTGDIAPLPPEQEACVRDLIGIPAPLATDTR